MPPIFGAWRLVALLLVVPAAWVYVWTLSPAQAETVAYRIEVRACRGADCRALPVSGRRWIGRFACEGHAATIERFADTLPPVPGLPKGTWVIRARCEAVEGMRGA